MHTFRFLSRALIAGCMVATAACEGGGGGPPVGPTPQPPTPGTLSIVAGRGQADSIQAILTQPLVVEVRDTKGVPMSGVNVTLTSGSAPGETAPASVLFAPAGSTVFLFALSAQTGADGRATVHVRMDSIAGRALVRAATTQPALSDTATFGISAGRAVRIVATPRDTTVTVPASYSLQAVGRDRYNNLVPVTRSARPRVTLEGETVRMAQPGREYVLLQAGALLDSVGLSAVPRGTVAFTHHREGSSAVAVMELDRAGYRPIAEFNNAPSGSTFVPEWSPDGQSLLFHTGDITGYLYMHRANGEYVGRLNTPADSSAMFAEWVSGDLIYFSGTSQTTHQIPVRGAVHRVNADGSNGARITTPAAGEYHKRPRVSPDGRWLVYANVVSNQMPYPDAVGTLMLMDMAGGSTTSLGVAANQGRWSPAGDRIAAVSNGSLVLITLGGGTQTLATGVHGDVEWSADGAFIVTRCGDNVCLVRTGTGEKIPLTYTDWRYRELAWKP